MPRAMCAFCDRPCSVCLCAELPQREEGLLRCPMRVVLLQHPQERRQKHQSDLFLLRTLSDVSVVVGRRGESGAGPLQGCAAVARGRRHPRPAEPLGARCQPGDLLAHAALEIRHDRRSGRHVAVRPGNVERLRGLADSPLCRRSVAHARCSSPARRGEICPGRGSWCASPSACQGTFKATAPPRRWRCSWTRWRAQGPKRRHLRRTADSLSRTDTSSIMRKLRIQEPLVCAGGPGCDESAEQTVLPPLSPGSVGTYKGGRFYEAVMRPLRLYVRLQLGHAQQVRHRVDRPGYDPGMIADFAAGGRPGQAGSPDGG
ncbi:unnamed protein product [Prorocentrum cordatum]|uniref:Uncharacterized protein n=1 Tax=Prorocentrum cordatum TaxID=2364126 RepID=A0ABN9R1X8_9DINO|nr:unnamed protein product [Polarella glacialis]